jgi:hypothetical protein
VSDPTTTDDSLADPETESLIIEDDDAVKVPDEERAVPEDANSYVPESEGFNEDGGKP